MVIGSLRPRKRDTWHTMLSLVRIREKEGKDVGLVKMSARLSLLEMNRTTSVGGNFITNKMEVDFNVLVRAWKAGFVDK